MSVYSQKLQQIRGQYYGQIYDRTRVEWALDYRPRDGDRILITYPRCGTVWTKHIILAVMSAGRSLEAQHSPEYSGYWMEGYGEEVLTRRALTDQSVTYMSTHISGKLLASESAAKYLMILRNPKDVCVSLYNYFPDLRAMGNFHQFFPRWLAGIDMYYGQYFATVRQFWEQRHHSNCTVLVYEHMAVDPEPSIRQIAQFLGPEYVDRLYQPYPVYGTGALSLTTTTIPTLLEQILRATSFGVMKPVVNSTQTRHRMADHLRKGSVGNWRSVLTRDESDLIDQRVRDEWMGTGFTPFINTTLVDHFEIVCNSGADSAVNISSIQLSAGQWGLEASCNGYQVVTYSSSNYIAVQLNPPLVFSLTFRSYHVSSYTNGMISTLSVH
ncbi:unnamed protein product, partial [Oppiella nova]